MLGVLVLAGPTSFAIGTMTGGSRPDLVVAVPDPQEDAVGSVRTLRLKPTGPVAVARTLVLTQASRSVPGSAETDDAVGSHTLLDHDHDHDGDGEGDGRADLDVGSRRENDSGSATRLRGSGAGFTTKGSKTFGLRTLGIPDREFADFGDPLGT